MQMNPAFRIAVKQEGNPRAAGDRKQIETYKASATPAPPINLQTWGHRAQVCRSFRKQGFRDRLEKAEADHADGYTKLPLKPDDGHIAVFTLRNPFDDELYGFVVRAQSSGASAASPHYNCLPRILALLSCRVVKISRVDSALPFLLADGALAYFAFLNNLLNVQLKVGKSEAGTAIDFIGATAHCPDSGEGVAEF